MTRVTLAAVVICGLGISCCGAPPRPWLRFEPAGRTNWTPAEGGVLVGRLHGTDVSIDLAKKDTSILVHVENRTPAAVEFRMGPEGSASRDAIGQVLLRPLAAVPTPGGQDYLAFTAMQPVKVDANSRGEFHLDSPLGRDPALGTYFVLTVEARDAAGVCERRTLPLEAVNSGTKPADGR